MIIEIIRMCKKILFITGTDTGVGKTVASVGLCLELDFDYWKPIQTGIPTDQDFVKQFLPKDRIHKSTYSFHAPLSPHHAAEKEGKIISLKNLTLPKIRRSGLVIEGIGGVLVPINNKDTVIDLIKKFSQEVCLVARSSVGTLNHTYLTLEALKHHGISVSHLILSGESHELNYRDLRKRIPKTYKFHWINPLTKTSLKKSFSNMKFSI